MYDRYGSSFETMGAGGPRAERGAGWGPAGFGPGGPGGFQAEDIDLGQFFGERFGQAGPGGLGDIFSQFRRSARRGGAARANRGADVSAEVEIPFNTSITGGEVHLALQRESGQAETILVKVPPGIEAGKKIRLRGQGGPARSGGTPGDLLLTVRVVPHPFFARRGNSLYVRVPVTMGEAAAGATVDVPTPKGTVSLHVPPGTSSGTKLRIKGHGVAAGSATPGDLLAEVQIVMPQKLTDADREAIRQIDQRYSQNPRQNLRW
jgi:DnaJ-class molecular chaperone